MLLRKGLIWIHMFHAMVRFTLILLFVVLDACKRVRESWTKGSSGVRPVILWAGLMGCEDMKTEDCTRVRIGLYLAWKASLATDYVDSL